MKSMPSGAPIANVPGVECAPQTATSADDVSLFFRKGHSKHRIQHHATPSSMVDHGATLDHPLYWLPKKPRPLHILQLQRVSLPPALHCQQLRKFQTCYVWFSQMYRKTSQLATSVGMEIMWWLIGSRTLQIPKPVFSHLLGICSMWIFGTLWCMDQAVNGWFEGH